jgi:hypothetical protein
MSHTLIIPVIHLEEDLRLLLRGRSRVFRAVTIIHQESGCLCALTNSLREVPLDSPSVLILPIPPVTGISALPPGLPREVVAVLAMGIDAAIEGRAMAWLRRDADGLFDPDVRILFPGPRMARTAAPGDSVSELSADQLERWSRTIEALGEEPLITLSRLTVGIVGLGRLGGDILQYLITLPVRRLVLIDGDTIERHNLGESHFSEFQIGMAKVIAWHDHLTLSQPQIEVDAHVNSVTDSTAMNALASCDVIFSSPDSPGARLAAAAVAVAHHIPLVDIGTRIHREPQANGEIMGADIRLVSGRCLLCWGGVSNQEIGRRIIASPDFERSYTDSRDWRAERRGSLGSLNLAAVALAGRMWEGFVAGTLRGPAWWHLGFGADGAPRVEALRPAKRPAKCACGLAGLGPRAYPSFGGVLRGGEVPRSRG